MTVQKQIGMRIRYLRTRKKWSQERLAFEADINKNYLSDLERGTRNPTLSILEKIAVALNENLESLFKGII